jgi:hypothetical protein
MHGNPSILLRAALIVAILMSSGCHSDPKNEALQTQVGWRPVETWSGHGDTQTESFDIQSTQWRVKWTTKNENPPGMGTFKVTAHSAISGRPIALVVEHKGVGSGIGYVDQDPRLYDLVIESRGIDWSVSVEEGVIGTE